VRRFVRSIYLSDLAKASEVFTERRHNMHYGDNC
jgi:hypothetical protein